MSMSTFRRFTSTIVLLVATACAYGTRDPSEYKENDDSALAGAEGPSVVTPPGIVVREWNFEEEGNYEGWAIEYTSELNVQSPRLRADAKVVIKKDESGAGVLSLDAPINGVQQNVQVSVKFPEETDLTGITFKARVRLQGSRRRHNDETRGVVPFAKASFVDNEYLGGGWHTVPVGNRWTEVRMQMRRPPQEGDASSAVDVTHRVVEIGLQLASGDDGDYTEGLELLIDKVWMEIDPNLEA